MASPAIVNFRRGREREREWGWKKNSEEWLTNWLSWVESVSSPKAWLDLRRLLSNNIAGFLPLFLLLLLLLISFKMCSFKIYIDYLDRIELVPLPLSFILLNLEYIAQTLRFVCVCVCVCGLGSSSPKLKSNTVDYRSGHRTKNNKSRRET